MAWEWAAPAATAAAGIGGVFFTWLAGRQGRKHAEYLVRESERAAREARIWAERRDAYMAALRAGQLIHRREKYERRGETEKLTALDEKWPPAERYAMQRDARVALTLFGSPAAVELYRRLDDSAVEGSPGERARRFTNALTELVREEFGLESVPYPSLGQD